MEFNQKAVDAADKFLFDVGAHQIYSALPYSEAVPLIEAIGIGTSTIDQPDFTKCNLSELLEGKSNG